MNSEKQSIYDIFRACRLCGAGGGYKMPIIQNVVNIDAVELRQKIRDCVQIEVHSDDKMPPLICELCIDKVNDFYEFFELCKQTNIKTRKRLGLPLQTTPQGTEEDCILGVTEPVFATHDSDDEPLTRNKPADRSKTKKAKAKERETKKIETTVSPPSLPVSKAKRSYPSPIPQIKIEPLLPSEVRTPVVESRSRPKPSTSVSKSDVKTAVVESKPRPKPASTPKVEEKSSSVKRKQPSAAGPASSKKAKKPEPAKERQRSPTPPIHSCDICGFTTTTAQGVRSHQRSHAASFTDTRLSCNACREWFTSGEAAAAHHRRHRAGRPYHCTYCYGDFDTINEFNRHFEEIPCKKFEELPDPKCESCWKEFPTRNILKQHRCLGPEGRPGGKCEDCLRTYATLKSLKKHACSGKRKKPSTVDISRIDPEMLAKVQPVQVRVAKCDPLLGNRIGDHIDISEVYGHYGTDLACYYPYKYYNSFVQPEESLYTSLRNTEDNSEVKNDASEVKNDASVVKNDDFGDNEDFTSNIDNIISSLDDSGKDFDFDSLKEGSSSKSAGVNGNESPVLGLTDPVENSDRSTEVNGVDPVEDSTKTTEKVEDNDTNDSEEPDNDSKSQLPDDDSTPKNDSPSKNKPLWTPQNDIESPKSDKPSLWTPQTDLSPKKDSISPKKDSISPKKDSISPKKDSISPKKDLISPKKDSISPKKDSISPKKNEVQTNGSKEMNDKEFMDALNEQIGESESKKNHEGLDNISDEEFNFDA